MRADYQLVLQLSGSSVRDFDAMVLLEDTIRQELGDLGDVDGHDVGSGEMNIFILTTDPVSAFERTRPVVAASAFATRYKAAFRAADGGTYTVLYPPGLGDFQIA